MIRFDYTLRVHAFHVQQAWNYNGLVVAFRYATATSFVPRFSKPSGLTYLSKECSRLRL